jgi:hypothetical protein
MSANRSVQAAQRRQTAASAPQQQRGPNTSIGSAQVFSQQGQQSTGKIAGQQAALAQKQQMMQQQQQRQQQQQQGGIEGVSKMTVPQAITLITLRLGKLEENTHKQIFSGENGGSQIDDSVIESIMNRLDAVEKREPSTAISAATTNATNAAANAEMILLKQQFEALKPVLTQLKTASTNVAKENKSLKQQIELLKNELDETKELVITLQNITMDNSQKISTFAFTNDDQLFSTEVVDDEEEDSAVVETEIDAESSISVTEDSIDTNAVSLKDLVEQELNA